MTARKFSPARSVFCPLTGESLTPYFGIRVCWCKNASSEISKDSTENSEECGKRRRASTVQFVPPGHPDSAGNSVADPVTAIKAKINLTLAGWGTHLFDCNSWRLDAPRPKRLCNARMIYSRASGDFPRLLCFFRNTPAADLLLQIPPAGRLLQYGRIRPSCC